MFLALKQARWVQNSSLHTLAVYINIFSNLGTSYLRRRYRSPAWASHLIYKRRHYDFLWRIERSQHISLGAVLKNTVQ
jgi:hypothetical protein